jgi:hypothetical protein
MSDVQFIDALIGTLAAPTPALPAALRAASALGTMAVQNASNVAITGGSISGTTISGVALDVSSAVQTYQGIDFLLAIDGGVLRKSGTGWYNVRDYGAIMDGSVHYLNSRYANLAAAQVDYPRATLASMTTETIDWHAIQRTIDVINANGRGGTLYSPWGLAVCIGPDSLELPLLSDLNGHPNYTASHMSVNIKGDGNAVSCWKFPNDTSGSPYDDNAYAIRCGPAAGERTAQTAGTRYQSGSGGQCPGYIEDICLWGPNVSNTLGAAGCNMSGICWAAHRSLNRVRIGSFYAGVDVVGDHTTFSDVKVYNCYYGWYINTNSISLYGDLHWTNKCATEFCRMACFGINYAGAIGTGTFTGRCFVGTSPFAFFREAVPASPAYTTQGSFLAQVRFDGLFMEQVGNFFCYDDNFRINGSMASTLDKCEWNTCSFNHNDSYKLTSIAFGRGFFYCGNINGGSINNFTSWSTSGMSQACIKVTGTIYAELRITGDIEAMFAGLGSTELLAIGNTQDASFLRLEHINGNASCGPWKGCMKPVYNGNTVTSGNVLCRLFDGVKQMAVTDLTITNRPFVGIARKTQNTPVSNTTFIPVAEEGEGVPVTTTGTASIQYGKKIAPATPGAVTDSFGPGDGLYVGYTEIASGRLTFRKADPIIIDRWFRTITPLTSLALTLTRAHHGQVILMNNAAGSVITVPETLDPGFWCEIIQNTANGITFSAGSGATLKGATAMSAINSRALLLVETVTTVYVPGSSPTAATGATWLATVL